MLRRVRRPLVLLVVLGLVAGCGSGKGDPRPGGPERSGGPVRGGSVTYGIEAETGDGWCLQESQLAISGILVARAIYDTLTVPDADGEYVPYLAEAVEPNDDFTEWTITVRDDVTFHDGTPLTAEVVKDNLDAYRGYVGPRDDEVRHPTREPLLFLFVMDNIDDVQVAGERDVVVTTKVPWVSFPAFLYSSGRLGITAQAQLDDTESCSRELIGTGPFMLESWEEGRELRAVRNPDYWQIAPDGEPYPYLEEIVFEPIIESEQRVNSLSAGDIDLAHFSGAPDLIELRSQQEAGDVATYESNANAEVSFLQMNVAQPPFDDVRIRRAMALAVDREDFTETINRGEFEMAAGPFAPGSPGYLEDPTATGFPVEQDLAEAERLVAEYEAENGPLRTITYQATPGAQTQETALYIQQVAAEIGVEVEIEVVQQDALIDNAIGGAFDIMGFRNYPGGDPDELYVWFKGQSPVNFSRFDDPEIDELLDAGRSEPDPEARARIYQDLNRRMGEQVYSIWANYTTWMIASSPTVSGYDTETMPALPDEDGRPSDRMPSEGLAAGHPLHGLWIDE